MSQEHPGLDNDQLKRLGAWLDTTDLPGKGAPVQADFISGGAQNHIYKITRGDFLGVLRIPPVTAPESRDEGIMREWRIIKALDGTDVPHTAAYGACEDKSVLGRSFYLMGFVDGWSPMAQRGAWPAPFDEDLGARQGLAYQLIEGISLMGAVDWKARGLEGLGRPAGFHERQVERWTRFFERIKTRELPGFDEAAQWLQTHKPRDFVPGIMHGDYQFANVMFAHGAPARLAAIIDWEMGTVGDPKLDLAWVLQSWPTDMDDKEATGKGYANLYGMPTKEQLLDHYHKTSGRQVEDIDYYLILAKFKMAIVLEQGFQRAGKDEKLLAFGPVVLSAMQGAADLAASTDYR